MPAAEHNLDGPATVDVQGLARCVGGILASQENNQGVNFLWPSNPTHGLTGDEFSPSPLVIPLGMETIFQGGTFNSPRANSIATNTFGYIVSGHGLCHAEDRGLGGSINEAGRHSLLA